MTVAELIEKLKGLDPAGVILLYGSEDDFYEAQQFVEGEYDVWIGRECYKKKGVLIL